MTNPKFIKYLFVFFFISLFQSAEFNLSCTSSELCFSSLGSEYQCINGKCQNEELYNFGAKWVFGMLLILSISSIANAGGVGGGAVLSAVYVLVFGYSMSDAIPLANIAIFAGAVINVWMLVGRRQKDDENQLYIKYRMVSLFMPLMISGSMVGVILNQFLPPIVIISFLTYFLISKTFGLYWTIKKEELKEEIKTLVEAKNSKEIELKEMSETDSSSNNKSPMTENLSKNDKSIDQISKSSDGYFKFKISRQSNEEIEELFENSKLDINKLLSRDYWYICKIGIVYLFFIGSLFIRGGRTLDSIIGISPCSILGWLVFGLTHLGFYYFFKLRGPEIDTTANPRESLLGGEVLLEEYKEENMVKDSFISGVIASTLGLGGGVVLLPILINRRMAPETASGICSVLVLMTSLSATTQFMIVGAFSFRDVVLISTLSGIGSFVGSKGIDYLVQKYNKPSLIIWMVFAIYLLSAFFLPLIGIQNIFSSSNALEFGLLC